MSKDERVFERERNKIGETAENIMKKNLLKIKRQKNPNAEVLSNEIRDYLSNPTKIPFAVEANKRNQGKKSTLVAKNNYQIESKESEDDSQSKSDDQSRIEMPQDEERSFLKERRPVLNLKE